MIVRPEELSRFKNLHLLARWVVEGFVTGLHRSPYHGASAEFLDYREYTPGDDLRRLDWKVYGRTDRTYIRRYQSETNARAFVLLDASASMAYKAEGRDKAAYAAGLAACLLYLFQRQGDAAGLVVFSDMIRNFFEARTSARHRRDLIAYLEKLSFSGRTAAKTVLDETAERLGRRSICVLISDFYDDPEAVAAGLRHLRFKHHEVIAFHLVDPTEESFQFDGLRSVIDLESGERLLVDAAVIRSEYQARFKAHCDQIHRLAGDCMVDHVLMRTDTPFAEALALYLHHRARRRR